MNPGDRVMVLPPFQEFWPAEQIVESVTTAADGQVVVFLVGVEGGFDPMYLEPAP